jgi:hypothetical protein
MERVLYCSLVSAIDPFTPEHVYIYAVMPHSHFEQTMVNTNGHTPIHTYFMHFTGSHGHPLSACLLPRSRMVALSENFSSVSWWYPRCGASSGSASGEVLRSVNNDRPRRWSSWASTTTMTALCFWSTAPRCATMYRRMTLSLMARLSFTTTMKVSRQYANLTTQTTVAPCTMCCTHSATQKCSSMALARCCLFLQFLVWRCSLSPHTTRLPWSCTTSRQMVSTRVRAFLYAYTHFMQSLHSRVHLLLAIIVHTTHILTQMTHPLFLSPSLFLHTYMFI